MPLINSARLLRRGISPHERGRGQSPEGTLDELEPGLGFASPPLLPLPPASAAGADEPPPSVVAEGFFDRAGTDAELDDLESVR